MPEHALMQRWRQAGTASLPGAVLDRLLSGASLHDLPLGEVDGRLDLRGLPVPVVRMPWGAWRDVRLENVDLSRAAMSNASFHGSTFVNCLFERADCSSAKWSGCLIEDCSFTRANLNSAALGTDNGVTAWRRVSLASADLRHAMGRHATFDGCFFDRARLAGTWLTSALRACHFAGKLQTLRIEGSDLDGGQPLAGTDFRDADLTEVRWVRVDLRMAQLPRNGPDHVVVDDWVDRLQGAQRALGAMGTQAAKLAAIPVDVGLRDAAAGQQVGVLGFAYLSPEARELLLGALAARKR